MHIYAVYYSSESSGAVVLSEQMCNFNPVWSDMCTQTVKQIIQRCMNITQTTKKISKGYIPNVAT